jgi:hypothetical protein
MSWFKRRPRIKEQPKQAPHHTSPFTEKMLEESKKNGPSTKKPKQDK